MSSSVNVISSLCSSKKIERDAGLAELQRILPNLDKKLRLELQKCTIQTLNDRGATWEATLGCLLGAKYLIQFINIDCEKESEFSKNVLSAAQTHLTGQDETRVQIAAGEVLGALCAKIGPSVYINTRETVLGLIQKGLAHSLEPSEVDKLTGNGERRLSTEIPGCGSLEASVRSLQAIVEGCGASFAKHIDQELLGLMAGTLEHRSRGVREAAFYLAATVASASADAENSSDDRETGAIFDLGQTLLPCFAEGLADEWSPVRLAASVAVRKFLLALPNNNSKQAFYPLLLPRMCLNRYYAAEGVRIYSQETWRQVAGCTGKELVQNHLSTIIEFYSQSTQSTSYASREAACTCIAELAQKLQPDCVRPHVVQLLKTLLLCFNDDSWPVRDAACLACGNFILTFPNESQPMLPELYPMFFRNLEDAIPSVRAGAAAALSNVVRALGEKSMPPLLAKVREGLQGLSRQPNDAPAATGVRQSLCNTMPPRLGRAGSTDHRFHRPPQPWELADGCVSLLAELSTIGSASGQLTPLLPLLAEACTRRHYVAHLNFLETICKHLPIIARGVGKKNFKAHLEGFFEPVFYALESENALTSSAASQCLNQLSAFLGPNIMRARVQTHSPLHLRHLDANLFIAPFYQMAVLFTVSTFKPDKIRRIFLSHSHFLPVIEHKSKMLEEKAIDVVMSVMK